jgi:hypothetical protein
VAVAAAAAVAVVAAVAVDAVAVGSPAAASRGSAILTIKGATARSDCYSVVFLYLYTTQQIQELSIVLVSGNSFTKYVRLKGLP